ncbi:hypothetical protein AVEN_43475-1 [Araneus ventricosus]|uniref:Uncharacterized protein n=1 Tax=Araneus ventricosus TaxID=182803 RepID=A0A4Y2GTC1_ARAVE|nr:hypothetical protein AVEN_43475-1 [Araneus ventricosus]
MKKEWIMSGRRKQREKDCRTVRKHSSQQAHISDKEFTYIKTGKSDDDSNCAESTVHHVSTNAIQTQEALASRRTKNRVFNHQPLTRV